MAVSIEDILKKYIELRDRQKDISDRHAEELRPLSDAMNDIENYLMHQMNTLGVDQLKAGGVGTAFKKHANSVQMQDPIAFKKFVFKPVVDGIQNYFVSAGYELSPEDVEHLATLMLNMPLWDMVDFRAGKKGIVEYTETEQAPVPGVTINTIATLNIRRA